MAYTTHLLVIANVTATSKDLIGALQERAARGPIACTLVMPAAAPGFAGRDAARAGLDEALATWREAGIEADGVIGDSDPILAVQECWRPDRFDEVVVSTLPGGASKWLRFDFPQRVARLTDARVEHVVARPPGWREPVAHREVPPGPHPLGPLAVLGWGGPRQA